MTTRIAWSTKLTGPGLTEWFPGIPVIDLAPCRHEVFVHWSALCTSQWCAWCSCSALCGGSSNLTWQQLHSDMRPGICPIYIHYDVQCHGTPSFKLFMLLGVGTCNALASNTKGLTAKGVFPQIAIAIGVLTSNRGEADEPLWRIGRGTRVPLQGAFVVCYGWGAKGDDQFWWSGRGAIAGCHCGVLWLGGGGWRPILVEWSWCHCRVPL